jgi:hypothetical protein
MYKYLLLLLLFISTSLSAQHSTEQDSTRHFKLGVQIMTLVVHTFKTGNPQRYDLRLDKHGYTVFIPGIIVNADWYFWKNKPKMQLRFAGGWYKDSGFNNAGYVHAAIRRDFFKKEGRKWYLIAGLGPAFFMRDNWNYLYPGRIIDPFYGDRITKNGLYQYRFFPIGGEIDFAAELNDKWDLNISMVPGAPAAIVFKFGVRCQL